MKIAIIGAGPAGIYTSLFLRNFSGTIDLFEKNPNIGTKLKLTGGGRMNLSNRNFSVQHFFSNEPNLLKNIFKNPASKQILSLFELIGTKYKYETERIILDSEDATNEVKRLFNLLNSQKNLTLHLNQTISQIQTINSKFKILNQLYDIVILTSGSQVNFGQPLQNPYILATSLGHNLTELFPALCAIQIPQNPFQDLAGINLDVKISQSKSREHFGKLLFTHQGISGPVVLNFTIHSLSTSINLNFLPNLEQKDFQKLIENKRKGKNQLKTFLSEFLPKRFVIWVMEKSDIPQNQNIADLSKATLERLLRYIYLFQVQEPQKASPQSSWTMRGGVDLKEVNPATLESKLHSNLFLGGEMLDITGLCGGYNLSFAILSAKIISDAIFNLHGKNSQNLLHE